MGGPVNKVAFLFGSAMIGEGNYVIMGQIAVAICVPPIAMGLAAMINKRKFTPSEREAGKATFTMGLFGITEGAIPFAAQDPLRVIPSIMVGSMTGSVIAMFGSVGDSVAHGGPIVAVLGAVDHVLMFFLAVIGGAAVSIIMVSLLKKDVAGVTPAVVGEGAKETPAGARKELAADTAAPVAADSAEVTSTVTNNDTATEAPAIRVEKLTDIVTMDLINLNLTGTTQDAVIDEMIGVLEQNGAVRADGDFKQAILAREQESSTGIGMNIAIPHGKSDAVLKPSVVFGIQQDGVDWKSLDGSEAKLIFMIAVPRNSKQNAHLKVLQMLSRKLMDDDFREALLAVTTKEEAYQLLDQVQ